MRYKTRTRDCHLIVKATTSLGESIDVKALDLFSKILPRGFLRVNAIKRNVIEYSGPIGISLFDRLKKSISKYDFLFIMEQLVLVIQAVEENNLQMCHVVLDLNNVYINNVTKEIQFLYVPLNKQYNTANIMSFVEAVVYSVIPANEQDSEFISRFIHFIKAQEAFAPATVEGYIAQENRNVVNILKKQNDGHSSILDNRFHRYYKHSDGDGSEISKENAFFKEKPVPKCESDQPANTTTDSAYGRAPHTASSNTDQITFDEDATGVFDEDATDVFDEDATGVFDEDATGVFGEDATGVFDEDATGVFDEDATGVFDEDAISVLIEEEIGLIPKNETELLEEDGTMLLLEKPAIIFPTLFRVSTEETININKPVFRLGKETYYVDYFVTNNNAVSRNHADIITRGTKYFVIDLNSKNHTYINDQMIAVQCETEIRNGDRLKLGNEEFIFQNKRISPPNVCRRCNKKIKYKGSFCIHCGSRIEQ